MGPLIKISFPRYHQQVSGETKAKGNNMPGNNASHGNQQCSVCARVCAVSSAVIKTCVIVSGTGYLSVCSDFFVSGGGAGAAGFAFPKLWTFPDNRNCSRDGCNAGVCRFASWFGFLRHTPAIRGPGQKNRHHLSSRFPHELPRVQRPLLAHLQSSTTRGPSGCTVTTQTTWTLNIPLTLLSSMKHLRAESLHLSHARYAVTARPVP